MTSDELTQIEAISPIARTAGDWARIIAALKEAWVERDAAIAAHADLLGI